MHFPSSMLVGLSAWVSISMARTFSPRSASLPSAYEGLLQGAAKTAYLIDTKNYTAFGEVMTKDILYDSSSLGAAYGGKAVGLDQVKSALEAAIGDSKVEHLVTNLYAKDLISPAKARVNFDITYSHWNESALDDITKTFRIYYQCDDVWVLEDGVWKMQTSYVTNMGPKVEAPYLGESKASQHGYSISFRYGHGRYG